MEIAILPVLILVLGVVIVARLRQSPAPSGATVATRASGAATTARTAPLTGARPQKVATQTVANASNPFRAVSIKAGSAACAEVQALEGERFLIGTVPHIPLAECGSKSCTCKYVHHEDRRHPDDERRAPAALTTDLYASTGNEERRGGRRGRRETD